MCLVSAYADSGRTFACLIPQTSVLTLAVANSQHLTTCAHLPHAEFGRLTLASWSNLAMASSGSVSTKRTCVQMCCDQTRVAVG